MTYDTTDKLWAWERGTPSWELGFLHTYPITMFTGVILSFLTVAYFWHRQKYSWEILQVLVILILPGAIFGARLWYLISEGGWANWYHLSGLSIQGGIMGALAFGLPYLYSRRHAVDPRTVLGIILPSIIIGQAIGRWGNFDNHEVYGKITDGSNLDWMGSMKSHMYIHDVSGFGYRQPLFFYEFISSTIGYLFIIWVLLRKNWVKPGVTGAIYLLWYGITRTAMEPLRADIDIMKWGDIPISLTLSIMMIVLGVAGIIWLQFLTKKKYDLIRPVKERRIFWVGPKSDTKKKYLFWGEVLPNKVNIWLPNHEPDKKWSKREINKGKRN